MKNKLPELIVRNKELTGDALNVISDKVDELIDYIAELTEVVENKKKSHFSEEDIEIIVEDIMQEINDIVYTEPISLLQLKEVEKSIWVDRIINRLMP